MHQWVHLCGWWYNQSIGYDYRELVISIFLRWLRYVKYKVYFINCSLSPSELILFGNHHPELSTNWKWDPPSKPIFPWEMKCDIGNVHTFLSMHLIVAISFIYHAENVTIIHQKSEDTAFWKISPHTLFYAAMGVPVGKLEHVSFVMDHRTATRWDQGMRRNEGA